MVMRTLRQKQPLPGAFELNARRRRQGPANPVHPPSKGGERRGVGPASDGSKWSRSDCRASVLIIVMWITFGLVCIALYFGHSMSLELRASDNRVAAIEAEQAIQGAVRYVSFVLSNNITGPGTVPDPQTYQAEAVQVGNGHFWLIGRTNNTNQPTFANFGLIDEASKLNLNYADSNMLSLLPGMTADLAANVIAWRSTNVNTGGGGAESDTYQRLPTPYLCKNAPFETVEELRLVYNIDTTNLYGEDANLNGVLDQNENDGDTLPPSDNQDGQLNSGLLEYVTVYTREPNVASNGTPRLNVTAATNTADTVLNVLTTNGISSDRAQTIVQNLGFSSGGGGVAAPGRGPATGGPPVGGGGGASPTFTSVLDFYIKSQMTAQEFALVEGSLRGSRVQGLVNVNTASAAVLACLPGMSASTAQQLVSYRQSNSQNPNSMSWVTQALDQNTASQLAGTTGPWLTGRSYQFTADIAALGHGGRGYRRTRFVFDTTQASPIVLYREDLTYLGWALGKQVRDRWLLTQNTR